MGKTTFQRRFSFFTFDNTSAIAYAGGTRRTNVIVHRVFVCRRTLCEFDYGFRFERLTWPNGTSIQKHKKDKRFTVELLLFTKSRLLRDANTSVSSKKKKKKQYAFVCRSLEYKCRYRVCMDERIKMLVMLHVFANRPPRVVRFLRR